MGKLRSEPDVQKVQSIFFAKEKMWSENKIQDWLLLHRHYMEPANVAENLLKDSKKVISVDEVVRMIQNVLPSPMVERSWGFGPQRLCQGTSRCFV